MAITKAAARNTAAKKAKPSNIAAATSKDALEASGAIMEPGAKANVDLGHPAVDNNPREGTTADQNRIDFNDPTLSQAEAVEKNLNK